MLKNENRMESLEEGRNGFESIKAKLQKPMAHSQMKGVFNWEWQINEENRSQWHVLMIEQVLN